MKYVMGWLILGLVAVPPFVGGLLFAGGAHFPGVLLALATPVILFVSAKAAEES